MASPSGAVATVLTVLLFLVRYAQGQGPGQMQSREVDMRVQFELEEGLPQGTVVGSIPTKPNFTYRFNDNPREFYLNGTTGMITTTMEIDRESLRNDRFDLVVLSSSPTYPIEVRIIILDINDNAPVFPEPSIEVAFSESANVGTRVILDTATDDDAGINDVTTDYKIISGNDEGKFRLIVTTNPSGETPYLHLETTGKLDREVKSFYQLNVSAQDGGHPPKLGYLQVNISILDINDNPPIFDHSDYSVSLNESVVPGTSVLQVRATDNDLGDNAKITYYLSETETQFAVDPQTGTISTMDHLNCQQNCPNLEGCPKSCVFTVFARDHGSPRQDGRAYVTVNLLDTNDHDPIIRFRFFPSTASFATVDENAQNGSVVAAVSVIDYDEGLNGETFVTIQGGNELGHFRLESTPSFDIVRVNGVLDREQIGKYNLTITATDKGSPPRSSTAFLIIHVNDVNDHEPLFEKSEYSAIVSELVPVGSYVAGITATDEDSGINSNVYYAIVSGNDKRWFHIDTLTGLVTTARPLNREEQDFVELKISARDGGPNPRWTHTFLKIQILDENDEAPTFVQPYINVSLSENAPVSSLVTVLSASDNDLGTNGSVLYYFAPETEQLYANVFSLDATYGRLTTRLQLDREEKDVYFLKVIAKDQGKPQLTSTVTVQLNVLDVNDNAPTFYPKQYFSAVSPHTEVGTVICRVRATDKDSNAVIIYSIVSGSDNKFQINSTTGEIRTISQLTGMKKTTHEIVVLVQNPGDREPQEKAVVIVYIKTGSTDDGQLRFSSSVGYNFAIEEDPEGQEPTTGREVGRVTLMRSSASSMAKFILADGDPEGCFAVDVRSGVITTAKRIDREKRPEYFLSIVAYGKGAFTRTEVRVAITDINDCPPAFGSPVSEVSIPENSPVGHEVYLAEAEDFDYGPNSRVEYSLILNPDNFFTINKTSGMVYLNRPLRFVPGVSYIVEISARDSGTPSLSSRQQVTVRVEDVNDHTPIFDHVGYETSLVESTPVNDRFFMLVATDEDTGENGRVSYEIVEGNEESKFGIFPDGFLYVRSSLDREKKDYYTLTVVARDNGARPRQSSVSVTIHVIDENDNAPQFLNKTFVFHIAENEPPDTYVGKLTAEDNDKGRNAEVTFSISSNQNDFMIDPKTGFIRTLHDFDREKLVEISGQDFIVIEAVVLDGGITRLRDEAKVTIFVTDVNDNSPQFVRTPYRTVVSEGAPLKTQVIKVSATDADDGLAGTVVYSIARGNEEGCFQIDETTGQITLAKALDRETTPRYTLTVTARDLAEDIAFTSTATVTIDVLDENDNAPQFVVAKHEVVIQENTQPGYRIFNFSAVDDDLGLNSEVTFSIATGNIKETFRIDSITGVLSVERPLDYEEQKVYYLNITASDGGAPRLASTIQFVVQVADVNDNAPVFPNVAIVRQIQEGIPINTPVVTISAEDRDADRNGKLVYNISQQDPPGHHFAIRPETGVIYTIQDIDREYSDTFKLTVVATDQALPESIRLSAEKTVTIIVEDINDNAPVFVSMDTGILPENSENGYSVMTVSAIDADANTNGMVTYELVDGDTDLFFLDKSTGGLYLSKRVDKPAVSYSLTVQATDEAAGSHRKSSRTRLTIIGVTKRAQGLVFSASEYSSSVYENEAVSTSVLTVRAHSQGDGQGEIVYYLTGITSNGLTQKRVFAVHRNTGVISTTAVLDRENGVQVYELDIYAVDVSAASPRTAKTKVSVSILDRNDSPPLFPAGPYTISLSEDTPAGYTVATLSAVDPDIEGTVTYTLLDSDDAKRFRLHPRSGVLVLQEPMDREIQAVHKLVVRADDGVQTSETTITIEVTDTNDNPPIFSDFAYSFDVSEDVQRGTPVGQVSAVDADLGLNAQVSYSVLSDWGNDIFSLHPQAGVFTLTSRLDYEQAQHYIFVVQAQDAGQPSLSSTVTVYFNVLDLNDNAPLFDPMSYSDEVFENVTVGTSIIKVSATDLDSGDNGRIVYSLVEGDDEGHFAIDGNGTIFTAKPLDREIKSFFSLVVSASDQAWPEERRLSSTVQVTIILKDVNDMSPEFVTPNETAVLENVPVGTVVMAIKAVDRDEGRNSYIEYGLAPSRDNRFALGPVDGLLRVNKPLDRETKSTYRVTVVARDRGHPPRSSSIAILVHILDENDNSPTFDPKQYSASLSENSSIGLSVLQISATDRDEGLSGQVRYSIIAGDPNHDFVIGEDTGIIRIGKNLDYERKNRYALTIQAVDGGSNVRHDTATVTVTIADVNDNPPTFLNSPYEVHTMENARMLPISLITITAFDADLLPNSKIHYLIKDGDKSAFHINSSSGEITLHRPLDREKQSEYILTILAVDSGTPRQTGTGTVVVMVNDINDNPPEFDREKYVATISENLPEYSPVITIEANDRDTGKNGELKYLLTGKHLDKFTVDPSTGTLLTKVVLDREEHDRYEMTLVAEDCGPTLRHVASVNVTILVEDENDNQPRFIDDAYTVYIPDNAVGGHFVFGAHAFDPDVGLNSRLVYHLSGTDADKFQINQDVGVVKLVQKLSPNDNGYHLEIHATDSGELPLSSSTKVQVHLHQASLFPQFRQGVRNFVFSEAAKNVSVTTVSATSPRSGSEGKLSYFVAGGDVRDSFEVNPKSGEVRIIGGLDFETVPRYELWVEARDGGSPPLSSVVKLDVKITDVNDNAPTFEFDFYNATIMEEQDPPQFVLTVRARDADSGDNGQVMYQLITSENAETPFTLDAKTGKIYTNVRLDREDTEVYRLVVEAADQGSPQKTGTATVFVTVLDKNDNPPRFTRLFSVNVTENAPLGTFVIQVTSSDKDIDLNANATYSFTENSDGKFHIDPVSGNVTVAGWIDREKKDEYLLKVAAIDGSWRAETPLTISVQDVNDNAPQFSKSAYVFNFAELQRSVAFVGQVSATDKDKQGANSIVSYSLKHASDIFRIDPASGEIFSKQVLRYKRTSKKASPENQHILQVVATDHGKPPLSTEVTVVINVVDSNNNPPVFDEPRYFSPVPESSMVGLSVLKVSAKDNEDVGINAEIEYLKVGGNGSDYFNIHGITGWITVTTPLIGRKDHWYELKVKAVDKGVPPKSSEVFVHLVVTSEDHYTPVFTALSYQVIIPENEPLHSEIVAVTATDADVGLNGKVTYAIASGNDNGEFDIGSDTGSVVIMKSLDYEKRKEYQLNITARDCGFNSKVATAMLTIIVTDVNDNPPTFNASSYTVYTPENEPVGTVVAQMVAKDADSSRHAVIQYSIIGDGAKEAFSIDSHTGTITSRQVFDYEEQSMYFIEIMASNPNSPQFSTTKVEVHIVGRNEFYPRFVQPVFQFTVSESAAMGTTVGTLMATDEDGGPDGEIFFLFVGNSNDRGFRINPNTGVITVARRLDRESQARVVLAVMAKNAGSIRGNDTDETQVVISIQDGNDPPVFSKPLYEAHVSESAPLGTSITTVSAVDKDVRPNNNQFSYSIMEGNIGKAFSIDHQSGIIHTSAVLDREVIPVYNLTIGAIDNGTPPQTGVTLVCVFIDDVNDNGPTFQPPEVVGYVLENEPAYTSVMVLSATDPDLPPNGAPFMYFLVGGEYKDMFQVDRHTGLLKTTKSIDRETTPTIQLVIEVHDSGVPQMKAQHPVTVVVLDKNDSPSSPRALTVTVWIHNGIFPGGKIADVHPLDMDTTGQYHCSLTKGDSAVFSIPTKCDLHMARMQNPNSYTVTVKGNDGRHPDVTSTVRVQFMTFQNETLESSVSIRIPNLAANDFLALYYERFQKQLDELFKPLGIPMLYSITTSNGQLELTLAVRKESSTYCSTEDVLARLQDHKAIISGITGQSEISIGYNPCDLAPCQNGGSCRASLDLQESLSIFDAPSVVFTSPTVSRQFSCSCKPGFSGTQCQFQQDPCSPNPCFSGGTCQPDGLDFQCICPSAFHGKRCEAPKTDVCTSGPCKNGGTCEETPNGSFFCLCRPGFRGSFCEQTTDGCRPNRCMNGGTCVSEKPGYRCLCESNFFGRHCEKSTSGFLPYSFMAFPSLDASTNDISIIFATNKKNSLLIYNYGIQSGGRSDFLALEISNGRLRFAFGGARTAIATITTNKDVTDGRWHKITVIRNGRVASLSVVDCAENGDSCQDCSHGNSNCSLSVSGHTGTLNFNNNPLYIGGIPSVDPLLERPGQVLSDDFVGCIHSVSVSGRMLDMTSPLKSQNVEPSCGRRNNACDERMMGCGEGATCTDLWFSTTCICKNDLNAPNCNEALIPFSLDAEGSYLELIPQEKLRRTSLLASSVFHHEGRWMRPAEIKQIKFLSLKFRTTAQDGLLLFSASEQDYTLVELSGGNIVYSTKTRAKDAISVTLDGPQVSGGQWHTLKLTREWGKTSAVNISVDGSQRNIESSSGLHDFLDPYLSVLSVGKIVGDAVSTRARSNGFQGCISTLTINDETQTFNRTGSYFRIAPHGLVHHGCTDKALGLNVATADPLSIGIILVIVFFIILILVILVSFVVFRKRKQRRGEKSPPSHLKHNGNAFVTSAIDAQGHQDSGFTESGPNDDGLRNHLPQDLVPKKMKDRDIMSERPQRPDIIEREVINKSPASAPLARVEESHEASKASNFSVHSMNDAEPPEHYDLENASSIAPSDIDIVYHYKGFRDGNVRKYKANSHLPNYHKHSHRHSPHQFQVNAVRESPRNVLRQSPNPVVPRESPSALKMQNTPLARLSPSSELSQQTPRILTLQDISGKPLQTALLATSQGVGSKEFKDPMTNSERSLNSPVSNLSHSTGSMNSAPQSTAKKKAGESNMTLGLTAEEIERLNARPRNSSLVSTLDAVSSSSEGNREKNKLAEFLETNTELLEAPDSSTDESGNDSFTCSEFEYDNNYEKGHRDFGPSNMIFSKLAEADNENDEDSAKTYDGFDSLRGSLSTLVASDDDVSHMSTYKPANGAMLGWDYLLNWGPNFENIAGMFNDISELPDAVNTSACGHAKASEEYV